MKYALLLLLFLAPVAYSQCISTPQDGCVLVNQSIIDRSSRAVDELIQARAALKTLSVTIDADSLALKTAQTAINTLRQAIETGKTIQDYQGQAIAMLHDVIKIQSEIIQTLEKQLNRPTSAFQRFLRTIEKAAILVIGIYLGKHI